MPMYATFYSFKGGVGRTLALANTATLLATDHDEPCRVLVWDFDLAAPGLQQVLKCRWKGKAREGFLDYVHHYCTKAEILPIERFVCKTDVPNVDMLPAGWMGRRYAARLDEIHWQEIYRQARGYQFMEATKKQIADLKPEYDYVLVDSLTGYSDVGGICVNQLADIVVLLFRLNRQNLEGISKVYRSIQKSNRQAVRTVGTVPVISPAWPFASPEADEWTRKVQRIFGDERLLTIAFDGSLSFGERILSRHRIRRPMSPKILDDYWRLARLLRRLNPQDPQTMYQSIQDLWGRDQFTQAFDACVRLVKKRPSRSEYWHRLVETALLSRRSAEADKLKDSAWGLVDEACQSGNHLAYVARYQLRSLFETKREEALRDLNKAIDIDSKGTEAYYLRGTELFRQARYEQALKDFTAFLDSQGTVPDKSPAHLMRAECYTGLGQNANALEAVRRAALLRPKDETVLVLLARKLYCCHKYTEAQEALKSALQVAPGSQKARVFSAHVLCALGDPAKAAEELRQIMQSPVAPVSDVLEVIEAYLLVDPKETLRLLDESGFVARLGKYKLVTHILRAVAAELVGAAEVRGKSMQCFNEEREAEADLHWSFAELKEFLEWGVERGCLNEEKKATLRAMIEHFETPRAGSRPL